MYINAPTYNTRVHEKIVRERNISKKKKEEEEKYIRGLVARVMESQSDDDDDDDTCLKYFGTRSKMEKNKHRKFKSKPQNCSFGRLNV